jgi:hypothetical protein
MRAGSRQLVGLSRFWHEGITQNSWAPYVFGAGFILVAALGGVTLSLTFKIPIVFAPYYPAVLFATLIAGPRSGGAALLLGIAQGGAARVILVQYRASAVDASPVLAAWKRTWAWD